MPAIKPTVMPLRRSRRIFGATPLLQELLVTIFFFRKLLPAIALSSRGQMSTLMRVWCSNDRQKAAGSIHGITLQNIRVKRTNAAKAPSKPIAMISDHFMSAT
jgi:hypothetical protein